MKHGGLFEGYGGTTFAAEKIFGPLDRAWYSDIKPASVTLLQHRHPGVLNLGDMTTVDWTQVEPVDVLTASWPCQPFSSAGSRLGEEDPRALWPHVARAVDAVRPAVFLGENVSRIAGTGELRRAVRTLADLGYVGAWRCNTAASVGAPHKRERCFVVAVRADTLGRLTLNDSGLTLHTDPLELLPTPTVRDGRRGKGWGNEPGRPLSETIHRLVDGWRGYEPAVRRWERVTGRHAPAPVQAFAAGAARSAALPEVRRMDDGPRLRARHRTLPRPDPQPATFPARRRRRPPAGRRRVRACLAAWTTA